MMPGALSGLVSGIDKVRAGYRVLRSTRMRSSMPGLPATGADAAWEFLAESDYYKHVAMARWTDQNDPIVGQAVDRLVDLVFKTGMKYDAATGHPEADAIIKKGWTSWSSDPERCDVRGRSTLAGLAKLVFRATVVDGDHLVIPLRGRRLQCIEGHRMQTPRSVKGASLNIHCGVLTDAEGRASEFWLSRKEHNPLSIAATEKDVTRYPAYFPSGRKAVLHIFNPKRVSQNRGISCFVRMMENAIFHSDLQFAMLLKEQAAACITILREKEAATDTMPLGGAAPFGPLEAVINRDGSVTRVHELRPGLEIEGRPGEKISINSPNLPGDGFLKHSIQILCFIAVNLGIPVQVLLLDPSQSNFSSWRGSMDVAQHGFVAIREWMITQFYTPIYLWWLREEIATNPDFAALYEVLGDNIFGHQWTPPYDPYIEPNKDVTAEEKQIGARLDSRRNVLARRGLDLDEVDRDIVTDQATLLHLCATAAAALAKLHPDAGFTWRDVYQVGAVAVSAPMAVAGEEEEEEGGTTKSTKNSKGEGN
jgi:lambda family phage portal protein